MKLTWALLLFSVFLHGCASGLVQPFGKDPVSGGVDTSQIVLLGVASPPGLQRYPSHSSIDNGRGLETMRGYVDQTACAMNLYTNLRQAGWQLRMHQRLGQRAIYIYQKSDTIAALVFRSQGALTVLEIWTGQRLVDNAAADFGVSKNTEGIRSIAPEQYGPAGEVETFGPAEREL